MVCAFNFLMYVCIRLPAGSLVAACELLAAACGIRCSEHGVLATEPPGKSLGFELWCWRRLLRVPWTARRSNQSILKESNPEYSLEGWMLKLKL